MSRSVPPFWTDETASGGRRAPARRRRRTLPATLPICLAAALLAGCPCPPCVRSPQPGFEDPEIVRLTAAQRRADLAYLTALLEQSYPHLEEKQRRFGIRIAAVVAEQAPALLRARNRYQYMNAVDRILVAFHDGHLTTRGYQRTFVNTYRPPTYRPPRRAKPRPTPVRVGVGLTLRYVAGQVVVVRVRPGSTGDRAGVKVGDVLELVGDQPALSRMGSSLRWRSWARLDAGLQLAASRVLVSRPWYPDTPLPSARVVIRRGGQRLHLTLVGGRTPEVETRAFGIRRHRCPGGAEVAVVRMGTFVGARKRIWKRVTALLDEARRARAVVLDVRGNRGGSQGLAHRLVARLITRPVVAGEYRYLRTEVLAARVPIISRLAVDPQSSRWTVWQKDTIRPAAAPLGLPVALVVDELCASACETVARALSAAPGIRLFGRATAGSSGMPVQVLLPHSQLIVSLPSWQSRTAGGRPVEGYGVVPHVKVPLRLAALSAGRDEPLERALGALCRRLASARAAR